jgi:CubicO group peptidase (beta-lactamase class C family)
MQPGTLPTSLEPVRDLIRHELVERSIPSLAVAVARDGQWMWQEGFGWADRERRLAASEHTMYSLASITKPITATALMLLVERGQIDLDQPVNAYLGDAPLRSRVDRHEATVRQVANHTAGLPLHYQFFYADRPEAPPAFEETIRRYGNLVTAPGERHQYSNLGYGVLDHVVAKAAGRGFGAFVREEVFLPLGMTRASIGLDPALAAYAATPYSEVGRPYPRYGFDHPGASAAFCSAHDLCRFGLFHVGTPLPDQRQILSAASRTVMQTAGEGTGEPGYGIGLRVQASLHRHRVVEHSGGMGGVSTVLRMLPDDGLVVVALCNASSDLPFRVADDVAAALLPTYAAARAAAPPEPAPTRMALKRDATWEASPALIGRWQGHAATYAGQVPAELRFVPGGFIHARFGDGLWTLLNNVTVDGPWLKGFSEGVMPTPDAERHLHRLYWDLRLRGDLLTGAVGTFNLDDEERQGRWLGNALCTWVELARANA